IAEVKERWGSLLDQGATAFWGNWDRHNTLAAGWASTPAYYFATTILGLRPLKPGFQVFAVEPHIVGLDWAKGSFPSLKGEIPVSWTVNAGEFRLEGEIPEGTSAEILIPSKGTVKPREVRLDGRKIWKTGKSSRNKAVQWVKAEEDGVRLHLTRTGKYELTAQY
ncbi:hypothetical protein MYX78_04310, partial [Acidobacteria bacterium AH-259-G07]|nr:hypothetical protein [Acidobacteria bacterium AH-259-G07]